MERRMIVSRRKVEAALDALIDLLDNAECDPDYEPEPLEEQHDREFDPVEDGIADRAALKFILAERSRRARQRRH